MPTLTEVIGLGGITSILAGIYWMLVTGRLVTRREMDRTVSILTETIDRQAAQLERVMGALDDLAAGGGRRTRR